MALTRAAITTKMNYSYPGPQGEYSVGFNNGLRETLATALTRQLNTDWHVFFNEAKIFDTRWYFRCDRRERANRNAVTPETRRRILASVNRIEAENPGIENRELTDLEWGELAGKHAAVRWLGEEERQAAEDFFPDCDT